MAHTDRYRHPRRDPNGNYKGKPIIPAKPFMNVLGVMTDGYNFKDLELDSIPVGGRLGVPIIDIDDNGIVYFGCGLERSNTDLKANPVQGARQIFPDLEEELRRIREDVEVGVQGARLADESGHYPTHQPSQSAHGILTFPYCNGVVLTRSDQGELSANELNHTLNELYRNRGFRRGEILGVRKIGNELFLYTEADTRLLTERANPKDKYFCYEVEDGIYLVMSTHKRRIRTIDVTESFDVRGGDDEELDLDFLVLSEMQSTVEEDETKFLLLTD